MIPNIYPASIYLLTVNNKSKTAICDTCSKFAKKAADYVTEDLLRYSSVSIVDFWQVNANREKLHPNSFQITLWTKSLTTTESTRFSYPAGTYIFKKSQKISIINFEQVNSCWVETVFQKYLI